ncbi:MAG: RecB family exonuclease [Burkholderiaceae bacterium]
MQIAQDALRQELRDALVYWNAYCEAERVSAQSAVADAGPMDGVLLTRPELGPTYLQCIALKPMLGPLPEVGILDDWVRRAQWRCARHSADTPRTETIRALELADALRTAPWIRRTFGESTRGLLDLAYDWVALFTRWDWLLAAWRLSGSPRPTCAPGAEPLEGLHALVAVYCAQTDPSDLPHWIAARSRSDTALRRVMGVFGQGPIDAEQIAAATVLFGQLPKLLHHPLSDLPDVHPLHLIWPELTDLRAGRAPQPDAWPSLASRRQHVAEQSLTTSNLRLACFEAAQLESAVDHAVDVIRAERDRDEAARIGVVAFDRLMARRLTVKLQQQGLSVEDPSGWALDTTAACAPIDGLLDLIQPHCTPQQAFHWLTLPMVQSALGTQSEALFDFYRTFRKRLPTASGFEALPSHLRLILLPLQRLATSKAPQTFDVWVDQVESALNDLGLAEGLAADAAGALVMATMRELKIEHLGAQEVPPQVRWTEFRAALSRRLSLARLPLKENRRPAARLSSLSEAALDGGLSAVILLGATEGQMLAPLPSPLLSRRQMDLACARQPESVDHAVALSHLSQILWRGTPLVCIGAPAQAGSQVRWASPLVRLRSVCPSAVQVSKLPTVERNPAVPRVIAPRAIAPRVIAPLPARISVTNLQALAVCPFQFFWRAQLELADWRPLASVEGPAERGTRLHQIAEAVPERLKQPSPPTDAEGWLTFLLETLSTRLGGQEPDLASHIELEQRLRALAQWLATPSLPLPIAAERPLEGVLAQSRQAVKGRADWLLENGVVDLKTTDPATLKSDIKTARTDLQLQVYHHLRSGAAPEEKAASLALLSVGVNEVGVVEVDPCEPLVQKLDETLLRIAQGHPLDALDAQGEGLACERCPARGACRPQEWCV